MKCLLVLLVSATLSACLGMPESVTPVNDFQLDRYLGKWYEVARLDHSFESGLEQVTAYYSLRDDGGISVINRGYLPDKDKWSEAEGKAYFVNEKTTGYLKVSFFGPFYGSYVIFYLDKDNYEYAFVSGPDKSYLWFLSRKPNPPQAVIEKFISMSNDLGFEANKLLFVNHNKNF